MSAADVIADSLRSAEDYGTYESDAASIVDALKGAGYAVVELPKQRIIPTGWNTECLGAWPAGRPSGEPVSAWPNGEVATPSGDFISATEARQLALALLAAADAAEVRP